MSINKILWILCIIIFGTGLVTAQDGDSAWTVTSTTDTELTTGPAGKVVSLAPDGQRLVQVERRSLCLYTLSLTQEFCIELDQNIRMAIETLRWSPDSRYLTFSEDFFRMFVPSSIWLVDIENQEVRALTEVHPGRIGLGDDDWPAIDVLPTWSPDGDLYFIRLTKVDGEQISPELYRFDDLNDEPIALGALHDFGMVATYGMAVSDQFIAFNSGPPAEDADRGLWIRALQDGELNQVLQTENPDIPYTMTVSPDNEMILFTSGEVYLTDPENPENSTARVVDITTGDLYLLDQNRRVLHGGWNPDGSAFAYVVMTTPEAPENGLYIADRAGTPGDMILAGDFYVPIMPGLPQLEWAANDTLLLGTREGFTALIVQLAQE